jgi:hypothetical protein
MKHSRVLFASAVAFVAAALLSVHRAPHPQERHTTAPTITVGVVARAQSMACFARCREAESTCSSGCYESYGECRGAAMAEAACRQSRDACARSCRATQSACVQRCL